MMPIGITMIMMSVEWFACIVKVTVEKEDKRAPTLICNLRSAKFSKKKSTHRLGSYCQLEKHSSEDWTDALGAQTFTLKMVENIAIRNCHLHLMDVSSKSNINIYHVEILVSEREKKQSFNLRFRAKLSGFKLLAHKASYICNCLRMNKKAVEKNKIRFDGLYQTDRSNNRPSSPPPSQ